MNMTGEASDTAVMIACPSCAELYASAERVRDIIRNSSCCTNITCLADMSHMPLDRVLALERGDHRTSDRRAS